MSETTASSDFSKQLSVPNESDKENSTSDPMPVPSTSSLKEELKNDSRRNLRKRKINLNALAKSISCPLVCQFQFCGIRLQDGESLEWHYEGHLAQELEKLDKKGGVRVKKNPLDFPDYRPRRRVRESAFERIKFRRETREALPMGERTQRSLDKAIRCPVCDETVCDDSDLQEHVEACLVATDPDEMEESRDREVSDDDDDDELDVDGRSGFEEYEWAGQKRVRATSLFEGGLRGAGFLTIKKSDENEVLDIENETEDDRFGPCQYSDCDVILPSVDSKEEEEERTRLRAATLGDNAKQKKMSDTLSDTEESSFTSDHDLSELSKTELCHKIKELVHKNEHLAQKTVCNVCMDCYSKPLVSITCYHVHCEECWLKALGTKKLCPQCKVITRPQDLRRIYL